MTASDLPAQTAPDTGRLTLEALREAGHALEALTKDAAALGLDHDTLFLLAGTITKVRAVIAKIEGGA